MAEESLWIPTEKVKDFLQHLLDEASPSDREAGPTYLMALTGIEKRKVWEIQNGWQWTREKRIPYLNVSFDLVERMLTHMGRPDYWHSFFGDIYEAESAPKRKICKECGEIKSVKEMRRPTSVGHPTTCIECLDKAAA